jgi:hypothetical protein
MVARSFSCRLPIKYRGDYEKRSLFVYPEFLSSILHHIIENALKALTEYLQTNQSINFSIS